MADIPPIALPAPIFRNASGDLDYAVNARYAEYVAGTWLAHVVVAGPMGAGETCTVEQRTAVVETWAQYHPPERLIVACWRRDEIDRALALGMRALVMLRCHTEPNLFAALAELPKASIAYTNPRYSRMTLTAAVVGQARRHGALPNGVKFSKVSLDELAQVRATGGTGLHIIHGSSRNIAGSLAAGVNIVVSSPMAALPRPWPAPNLTAVQRAADKLQETLDAQPDHSARVAIIATLAQATLDSPSLGPCG